MAYLTIAAPVSAEIEIKRSRFLATIAPVANEVAAREVIAGCREDHPKARHHCMAFVLGPEGRTQRFSDDGEPAGTAGAPILDVLTGHDLKDIVAVVTRYFGGTKLGAGGLVRAYGEAVSVGLESARIIEHHLLTPVTAHLPYPAAEALSRQAETLGWATSAQYGADVELTVAVPRGDEDAVVAAFADASAGQAEPEVGEPRWV